MELMRKIRHRVGYVWGWRAKHWWLDTHEGAVTRLTGLVLCALVGVIQFVRAGIAAATPPAPGQPREAIVWVVVWLVVALVVGLALALMASKPPKPTDDSPKGPTTQDGQSVKRYYGTCWVDDPGMAAWKVVGRDPIKVKGGKK